MRISVHFNKRFFFNQNSLPNFFFGCINHYEEKKWIKPKLIEIITCIYISTENTTEAQAESSPPEEAPGK